ncbi:secreted and transmembrane protein 1A-like [Sigmodon hispidus]
MKTCPSVSTVHIPRMFGILLLAVSLNAQNESWDYPVCTQGTLSVPRGSHAVMTCNISNTFRDVTIELTTNEKTRTIFNQTPPGNYSNDSWQLQIQGGQSQLIITDAQNIHAGLYLWRLWGRQKNYRSTILNVSEPSNKNETKDMKDFISPPVSSPQLEARPETLVGVVVTVILILGLAAISALICYRHHHS